MDNNSVNVIAAERSVPCQHRSDLFTNAPHPADAEFVLMSEAQQIKAAQVKDDLEQQALAICGGCPVIAACRTWIASVEVSGVAGGTLERERTAERSLIESTIEGGAAPDARDSVIALLHDGYDASFVREFISNRFGEKQALKFRSLTHIPAEDDDLVEWRESLIAEAESLLRFGGYGHAFSSLQAATIHLYDHLAVNGPMAKDAAIRYLENSVNDEEALAWAKRRNRNLGTVDQQKAVGRRDSALQKLRYATQGNHHLVAVNVNGISGVTLAPQVAKAWQEWKAAKADEARKLA